MNERLAESAARRHDLGDGAIRIFDGLFEEPLVRMIHHYVSHLPFGLADYDTEETQQVLHWVHDFDVQRPSDVPPMRELIRRATDITRDLYSSRALTLERVQCNAHLYGDFQHVHQDLMPGVTALYYANPRWQDDWMGDTLFYDAGGEAMYAVAPKPGRLAVFDGHLKHRAGVPSRQCAVARFSIALKFSMRGSE